MIMTYDEERILFEDQLGTKRTEEGPPFPFYSIQHHRAHNFTSVFYSPNYIFILECTVVFIKQPKLQHN